MIKACFFSFLLVIFISTLSYAKSTKASPVKTAPKAQASAQLIKVLEKYSSANTIAMELVKTDEKTTLGTKNTSRGEMKYADGNIYLVLKSDKKVEFFYKNKKIDLVEYPDQDFDKNGKRKVTVLTKTKPALISGLLDLFSNTKRFLQNFEVISEKKEKDILTARLKPHIKDLKEFTLVLNTKDNLIESIIFIDEIDTKTTLELKNLKLNTKIAKMVFDFKPLKSDEVIPE